MKIRIIILALTLIGITTSCIAKNPQKVANTSIVGTWSHNDGDDTDYYQFNADGTGYEWEVSKYAPTNYQPRKKSFTYEIKNGRIIFVEHDGDVESESLKVSGKGRIKIDHEVYHLVK
ncbi:MAG: DUF5640 domain-containing protein [Bacteroidaceae bacterium]|nr:DUF5640 domain-containing protein [Bacteroidaceae bacterium]